MTKLKVIYTNDIHGEFKKLNKITTLYNKEKNTLKKGDKIISVNTGDFLDDLVVKSAYDYGNMVCQQ